ncbi:MAG: serine protein kinase RIO [Proteobacteria bacterium]|jgi:RIO kinase 1|nr:serine protein kinase RIO [Pseudomonadota bacterium]
MRVPQRLVPLMEQGVIQEVVRPLMSGKEAQVYLVVADGMYRVAKVYKEADQRSFKHRAEYSEGRRVRNSRAARAMAKRSSYGREQIEAAWQSAEVDAIYRLTAAGIRVPEPVSFIDGVLVMELICDDEGQPAPRLVDISPDEESAKKLFHYLLQEVVKMLCAGVVHGDLSDFNILMGASGPVFIDFPQAVDAAQNRNAKTLLMRDVKNLTNFLARFVPELRKSQYGEEMWALYAGNNLTPDSRLTGRFRRSTHQANTQSILDEIEAVEREARRRRKALGLPPPRMARKPIYHEAPTPTPLDHPRKPKPTKPSRKKRSKRPVAEVDPFADLDLLLIVDD